MRIYFAHPGHDHSTNDSTHLVLYIAVAGFLLTVIATVIFIVKRSKSKIEGKSPKE